MKQKNQGFIIPLLITIVALLAVGGGVYVYVNKASDSQIINQDQNESNNMVTKSKSKTTNYTPTSICGQNFYGDKYIIENIDVTQKIIELVNKEYIMANDKTKTNCYWWLERNINSVRDLELKTDAEETDKELTIYITSPKDSYLYLGEGFIIDKKTYDIYNQNAYDGERGNKIGNLKY